MENKLNPLYLGLLLFAFISFTPSLVAQDFNCPSIECGNLNVNFNNEGNVIFCEGSTITLINESAEGFDFFIVDWGDGTVDTYENYDNPQHQYDIPDSVVCDRPQTAFNVVFRGVARCADGNSCQSGSYEFGIIPKPLARFGVPEKVCLEEGFTPSNSSCHADSFEWDFGDGSPISTEESPTHPYASTGEYTVTLTVYNNCGSDTYTRKVEVIADPEADFEQSAEGGCANTVIDFTDLSNEFSNSRWNISPDGDENWVFTDTATMNRGSKNISVIFKQPITYTVELVASNFCGEDVKERTLSFEDAPTVSLNQPLPACDEITVSPADLQFAIEGTFESIDWTLTGGMPGTASGADFGQVTFDQSGLIELAVTGSCGTINRSVEIEVAASQSITIPPLPDYCAGSSPDTLRAVPPGGTWSGQGILQDSIFDPSVFTGTDGQQTYLLTYRLDNAPCNNEATVEVTVRASESVEVMDEVLCLDSPAQTLTASRTGGTWSGIGIVDSVAGIFDPLQSQEGIFKPVYRFEDTNGCEVTSSPTITVDAPPALVLPEQIVLCVGNIDVDLKEAVAIEVDSAGGTFSWSGLGIADNSSIFNAEAGNLQVGSHTVYVAYTRRACQVRDSLRIELTEAEALLIDPVMPVCISEDTLQLTANLADGRWSGPGIDPITGKIDLRAAGGDIHTYTYRFAAGSSCEQTESVMVEIIDLESAVSAGSPVELCEGPSEYQLLGAAPADGTWQGQGITDGSRGLIDLDSLVPGEVYTYQYCIESEMVNGCAACASKQLTYNPKPEAGFTIEGSPCKDEVFTLIPAQTGLDYFWEFDRGGATSTEAQPTHSYTAGGTKTLTQIVSTTAGCADTTARELQIITPPTASMNIPDREGCAPFSLQVADLSSGDEITSRVWCVNGDTIDNPEITPYVLDSLTEDTYFRVELKVTNLCDTRIATDSVLVHPYPIADFGLNELEGCSPFQPEVNNITLGNPENYCWWINGDKYSTELEPELPALTTTRDEVSTYTLELVADNACGVDTAMKQVTIYPPDVEAFIELDSTVACQPYLAQPRSFSTPGSVLTWEVFRPDGTPFSGGSGPQPRMDLQEPGLYTVVLYASRCGTDQDTAEIEILPAPQVNFAEPETICIGDTIRFQNDSQEIAKSTWYFGDGDSSAVFAPVHQYDSAGVFSVTYTGTSRINNCPASVTKPLTVLGLPRSAFSPAITSGCPPFEVAFTNQSTGFGALEFLWDFGDGSNASRMQEPVHTFTEPGTYRVQLTAIDEAGCFSDTTSTLITVFPKPVSAFQLSGDTLCLANDTLRVINQSIDAVSANWQFGEAVSLIADTAALPLVPGQYSVALTVENSFGCRDSSSKTYDVLSSSTATFSASAPAICQGASIAFSNGSSAADRYLWDFGDRTGSSETTPEHTFATAGNFTVSLTAISDNGCPQDQTTQTITVHPNPTASFVVDQAMECGAPAEVSFINNSTGNLRNIWAFGDGEASEALEPVHSYTEPGQYQISLITLTDFGCTDTTAQTIDIFGNPVAEATLSAQRVCAGTRVVLTATPTQALTYEWYLLPNLQPDTGRVISYTIDQPGAYSFSLIAIYNEQCRDTLFLNQALTVFEQPVADFDFISDEDDALIGDVRFINRSSNADAYFWELGDGTTSTAFEPIHEYDINRDILVKLIASNNNAGLFFCSDTIAKPVEPEWITSFEVPTAFSPDYGEPVVRVFGAVGSGVESYKLSVYSPYGTLVWTTSALEAGSPTGRWDGIYDNSEAPQGVYSWEAEVLFVNGNSERKKGTVTLLR